MKRRLCRSFILSALVIGCIAVLSAPAMAQVCNGTNVVTIVAGSVTTNRVPSTTANAGSVSQLRYRFGNDASSDCDNDDTNGGISQTVTQVTVRPSCNFVGGTCVPDAGADDGATPAVEFLSLDATTCAGGLGNITVDTTDPFATKLNFTVPLVFAPGTNCTVDVTLNVRERGDATTTNTIAQQYSTNGICTCTPPLPSSGSASSQLLLTCPPCDDGNACTLEACNAETVLCEQTRGPLSCTATDTACIDFECNPAGTQDNCDSVVNTAPACTGTDTACTDFECNPGPPGTPYSPNCDRVANTAPACTDSGCTDRECLPGPPGTPYSPNCNDVTNAPSCAGLGDACNLYVCDDSGTVYNPNCNTHTSAPPCTDSGCTDRECAPGAPGSPYNPNCNNVINAPSCAGLGDACNLYQCDDSGTVYNPNCNSHTSAPACTDSGCTDLECAAGAPGTAYNPNCNSRTDAPSCAGLGDRCNEYTCDDSGTVYRPNCDTHTSAPACDDTKCDHHNCEPGTPGSAYDPNCDGTTTIEPPPPACVPLICRTPGFWGTHADADPGKACSQDITGAVIAMAGGTISVCGECISNGNTGETLPPKNAASAVEALCVRVQGQSQRQLARQLTAAALNCIMSTGSSPTCANTAVIDWATCNAVCQGTSTAKTVGQCIDEIDAFNNGIGTGCHDRDVPLDTIFPGGTRCTRGGEAVQGPAGSNDECSAATDSPCTVIQPNESRCTSDSCQ